MPNSIRKQARIRRVSRYGGSRKLSCCGCFPGGIFIALPYQDGSRIPAKLDTIRDNSPISVRIMPMPAPASPQVHKVFDYASLDAGTSQFVLEQTGEIRGLMKRTAQGIVEIGQKLIEVKAKLGHGRFGDWLEAEFDWSWDTASNFMRVAQRFGDDPKFSDFAPSALYLLSTPSTPETARLEAIARASAGEPITYTTAKAIRQKHKVPSSPKPKAEPASQAQPTPIPAPPPQSGSKLEIVAIRSQVHAQTLEAATTFVVPQTTQVLSISQPIQPASTPDVPGAWWRLGGRHFLYCGDPNSPEFLARITEEQVRLLLAFPPITGWQPTIKAQTRLITNDYLPQGKNLDQLDEILEANILFYSELKDLVVSCFLPSPVILSIINRQGRCLLAAEPDLRRVNAVILDWKKAGLKAERMS